MKQGPSAAQEALPADTAAGGLSSVSGTTASNGGFLRLLLGSDPRTAKQLRFCLLAMVQHLAWGLVFAYIGYKSPQDRQVLQLIVINLIGISVFFPCVRLGWTAHFRDSGMVQPQMLWASLGGALAFALVPALRPAQLQLLCVIQVWGFFHLRPWQLVTTGGGAAVMLLIVLGIGMAGKLPDFDPQEEIYPALLTLIVLSSITGVAIEHSRRRGRLSAGKAELNVAVAAVRDLVIRDSLTGLFNRRHMQELLQAEQARSEQTGHGFAVALMDLDHFKRINDSHGHAAGDDVLRRFAELAGASVRQCDTIARWGGEEFLVLMPETSAEEKALSPLERLQADLRQQPTTSLLARVGLTFSAGLAFHRPGEPMPQSIASADRALYAAKAAGRNRVLVAAAG